MDSYSPSSPFDWISLPAGKARFAGLVRGIDEAGHETVAAEIDSREFFGEIRRAFLPNDNDFNIEVVSFGYTRKEDLGTPMGGSRQAFSSQESLTIQTLLTQLVVAGTHSGERPSLLIEYPNARFMGEVRFKDGWVMVADEGIAS